jgi:hypothetical protein
MDSVRQDIRVMDASKEKTTDKGEWMKKTVLSLNELRQGHEEEKSTLGAT